jgi:hypothetical protein
MADLDFPYSMFMFVYSTVLLGKCDVFLPQSSRSKIPVFQWDLWCSF